MKFFLPLAILTSAGASAQTTSAVAGGSGSGCLADYIVTRCLETEEPKAKACVSTDYKCLCSAYEAIATCYNNCPKDPRAFAANNQVTVYCAHVSTSTSTSTSGTMTPSSSETTTAASPTTTTSRERTANTQTFSAESPENTGAASALMFNIGGMVLGVAGAVAAVM